MLCTRPCGGGEGGVAYTMTRSQSLQQDMALQLAARCAATMLTEPNQKFEYAYAHLAAL